MPDITRLVALLMAFFTLITSLASILEPAPPEKPEFPDTAYREKIPFDEGEFILKSCDIFVSPDGNDKNAGGENSPLKTVAAAKEKARLLKNADCGHVTVWFREGEYSVTDTLEFNSEDLSDVTYRSYPNEEVVFSGAKSIFGWTEATVNGVRAFVTDYTVSSDESFPNVLFNGDIRLSRPVYPKAGEFSVVEARDEDCFAPTVDLFKLHAAFYAKPSDLKSFKNLNDVDVRILHYWNDELLPVSSMDLSSGRIETQKPASMTVQSGDRFFFENVFEALSEPGEWYLDRTDSKLYYIPFEGEKPESTVLKMGVNERLITLDGCSNIEFQGIIFRDSNWEICSGEHFVAFPDNAEHPLYKNIKYLPNFPQACYDTPCAITLTNCTGISFIDCELKCIGSSGLMFGPGTTGCLARACKFDDIGGNAVYIKGVNVKDSEDCTSGITVTDCHIKTYGRVFNNAIGILLVHAFNCELSQNEIHDGFYTGISSGWLWGYTFNITDNIKIKNNLIYDIGQGWLSDMGGIYSLGIQPNSVISGNVIHDVGCYGGGGGYGGWGVYLDEGSSEVLVEKNLCYNCSSQGFHQHYGKENIIRNNIFALNSDAQLRVSRKEEHTSIILTNNIFLSDGSPMYASIVEGKLKDDSNLYWDYTNGKKVVSCTDDKGNDPISVNRAEKMGYYNNALFADPMFKDAANGDFTLALNSPALDIGFEPWDYSQAGTITLFE